MNIDSKTCKCGNKRVLYLFLAVISVIGTSYYFLSSTGNIFNIVFLFLFYYFYVKNGFSGSKRQKIFSLSLASFYSLLLSIGRISRSDENMTDFLKRYIDSVHKDQFHKEIALNGWSAVTDKLMIIVMFIGVSIILYFIFLQVIKLIEKNKANATVLYPNIDSTKLFIVSFFVILVLWMPYFIINYPGVLTSDSINQISQIEGVKPYSNHHPLIHTFLIQIFYNFGKVHFYDVNTGVAIYTFVQMCILSAIYSYLIKVLYENGLKLKYCVWILLYFAVVPINPMYAIAYEKGSLYAGFVLLFSVFLYQIFVCKKEEIIKKLIFPVTILFVTMFRTNGLIVYILCIPFMLFFARGFDKKIKKRLYITAIIPLFLSMLLTNVVYKNCGFEENNIVESLSMPIRHIGRVVVDCEDDLTEDEITAIQKFMAPNLNDIKEVYNCRFSDPMKNLLWSRQKEDVISENKAEFMKLYLILGIKHPLTYLKAQIDATLGYFNSDIQYIYTNIYGIAPNDFGITMAQNPEGELYKTMKKWCELFRYIPLLGNLFTPASMFLVTFFITSLYVYFKKYKYIIVSLPVLIDLFTIFISSPLHSEIRYVYSLFLTIPLTVFVFYMWANNKDDCKRKA